MHAEFGKVDLGRPREYFYRLFLLLFVVRSAPTNVKVSVVELRPHFVVAAFILFPNFRYLSGTVSAICEDHCDLQG